MMPMATPSGAFTSSCSGGQLTFRNSTGISDRITVKGVAFTRKKRIVSEQRSPYPVDMASSQVVIDEARWQVVLAREVCGNERFVYAVRSTGVYCRPGCPARRPRRDNVLFFPVPDAAERAGFRPCRRCRPEQPRGTSPQVDLVRSACRTIEQNSDSPLPLDALSAKLHVSPYHLERTFKRHLGITRMR